MLHIFSTANLLLAKCGAQCLDQLRRYGGGLYRLASSELRRSYSKRDRHAVYLEYLQRHVALAACHPHGNFPHGMNDTPWIDKFGPEMLNVPPATASTQHFGRFTQTQQQTQQPHNNQQSTRGGNFTRASFLNPNEPIARKLASLAKHLLSEEELSGLLSRAAPTPAAVEGGFGFGAPGVHAASAAVSRAFHWQH